MTYSPSASRLKREEAARQASRKSKLIAAISSLVIFGAVAAIILTAQGFTVVRQSFFSPHYALKAKSCDIVSHPVPRQSISTIPHRNNHS